VYKHRKVKPLSIGDKVLLEAQLIKLSNYKVKLMKVFTFDITVCDFGIKDHDVFIEVFKAHGLEDIAIRTFQDDNVLNLTLQVAAEDLPNAIYNATHQVQEALKELIIQSVTQAPYEKW
jgi:hypothetical protein